jgi:hypothetical protein
MPGFCPQLFFMCVYGGRYLVMALVASLVARPVADGRGWGRAHHNAPRVFDSKRHIRRELKYSFFTVVIFGMVIATLIGTGLMGSSLLYYQLDRYPAWWFGLSIVVMLLLHDTFFYWIHRAMHWRKLVCRDAQSAPPIGSPHRVCGLQFSPDRGPGRGTDRHRHYFHHAGASPGLFCLSNPVHRLQRVWPLRARVLSAGHANPSLGAVGSTPPRRTRPTMARGATTMASIFCFGTV